MYKLGKYYAYNNYVLYNLRIKRLGFFFIGLIE